MHFLNSGVQDESAEFRVEAPFHEIKAPLLFVRFVLRWGVSGLLAVLLLLGLLVEFRLEVIPNIRIIISMPDSGNIVGGSHVVGGVEIGGIAHPPGPRILHELSDIVDLENATAHGQYLIKLCRKVMKSPKIQLKSKMRCWSRSAKISYDNSINWRSRQEAKTTRCSSKMIGPT